MCFQWYIYLKLAFFKVSIEIHCIHMLNNNISPLISSSLEDVVATGQALALTSTEVRESESEKLGY